MVAEEAQSWIVELFPSVDGFVSWFEAIWPKLVFTVHFKYLKHSDLPIEDAEDIAGRSLEAVIEERRRWNRRRPETPDELGRLLFGTARSYASHLKKAREEVESTS